MTRLLCVALVLAASGFPVRAGQDADLLPADVGLVRSAVMYWIVSGESFSEAMDRSRDNASQPDYVRGPDRAQLRGLLLPSQPMDNEVREYVWEVLETSLGQTVFSRSDPQVGLLEQVGPEHLDILLETLAENSLQPLEMARYVMEHGWFHSLGPGHPLREFYVMEAVTRLAGPEHRALVLQYLPRYKDLVKVVLKQGWAREARDILLSTLDDDQLLLPVEWIEAVARLADPATYPQLKELFARGPEWFRTYSILEELPGLDLGEVVSEAWETNKDKPWGQAELAPAAARFGHRDALDYLVDRLDGSMEPRWRPGYAPREMVLRLLEVEGSDRFIVDWYREHRARLEFDAESGRYVLP